MLVIAAGLLAYHNSFTGPFIFDDLRSIRDNPAIRHLWPIGQVLSPSHKGDSTIEGRPLVKLSLAVNYALGGYDVWGYHALNLAVHILAGLTLFGIVRRTLLQPSVPERFGAAATELALAVAVLWTVHPLQTESVTYIVQRTESIMGLCYLLTLYCFIRGVASPLPRWWYGLCITACAMGMASKEVMVTAPLIVLLYDRVFLGSSLRELWRQRAPVYIGLAATWLMLAVLVAITPRTMTGFAIEGLTPWDYLKTEAGVIVHYLRLCFWPHPLVIDYSDWPVARSLKDCLIPGIVVAGLLGASAWAFRRRSWMGFLGAWFFLVLAPTSSILPSLGEAAAERRMYLPLAAVLTMAVIGVYTLAGRRGMPFLLVSAAALGLLTSRRNEDYRSELAIWNDTVAKRPQNARAHDNLGFTLWNAGNVPDAIEQFEQALRIKPDFVAAHNNLAVALIRLGKVQQAVDQFKQALQLRPDSAELHYSTAAALLLLGKTSEAIEQYEQVVRIQPDNVEAHRNLGLALLQTRRFREAVEQYEQCLRIKPDYSDVQNNLAWLLATLKPSDGGDPARAVTLAERACKLTSNRVAAYLDTLAAAYAATGRFIDAVATAQRAIDLANAAGQSQVASDIEPRLQLYRNGLAYHQPATATSPNP